MAAFMIGDKVEVIEHTNKQNIGKRARVISLGSSIPPTMPGEAIPTNTELRFNVELDNRQTLYNLRESQIRKL